MSKKKKLISKPNATINTINFIALFVKMAMVFVTVLVTLAIIYKLIFTNNGNFEITLLGQEYNYTLNWLNSIGIIAMLILGTLSLHRFNNFLDNIFIEEKIFNNTTVKCLNEIFIFTAIIWIINYILNKDFNLSLLIIVGLFNIFKYIFIYGQNLKNKK